MLGRQMREIVPVAFLPENHALAVAAMSYNGKLDFGLLGDYDAIPDLERMAEFFEESLDELLTAAGKSRRKGGATAPKPRRAAAKQAKATATKSKAAAGKPKSAAATRKAAAQPKTATKRPKAATAAGSNGRPAKRSAIRGKAQRPRLIDSDGD